MSPFEVITLNESKNRSKSVFTFCSTEVAAVTCEDLIDTLAQLFAKCGLPQCMRSRPTLRVRARGPELTARATPPLQQHTETR